MSTRRRGFQGGLFPECVDRVLELPPCSIAACTEAKQNLRAIGVCRDSTLRDQFVSEVFGRWCPACFPPHPVTGSMLHILTEAPAGNWKKKKLPGWEVWSMNAMIMGDVYEKPTVLICCPVPARILVPFDESTMPVPITAQHVSILCKNYTVENAASLGLTADQVYTLVKSILTLVPCCYGFETLRIKGKQKGIILSWQKFDPNSIMQVLDINNRAVRFQSRARVANWLMHAPRVETAVGTMHLMAGADELTSAEQLTSADSDELATSAVQSAQVWQRERRRAAAAARAAEGWSPTSELADCIATVTRVRRWP